MGYVASISEVRDLFVPSQFVWCGWCGGSSTCSHSTDKGKGTLEAVVQCADVVVLFVRTGGVGSFQGYRVDQKDIPKNGKRHP